MNATFQISVSIKPFEFLTLRLFWGLRVFVVFFEQMAIHLRIDRRRGSGGGGFHDFEGFSSLNFWPKSKNNHNFFFTAVVFCFLSRRRKISQCVSAANVRFVAACIKDELRMKPTLVVFLTFSTFWRRSPTTTTFFPIICGSVAAQLEAFYEV